MSFKRYTVTRPDANEEPKGFILDGWDAKSGREFSETFRCRPRLAAGALLNFGTSGGENGLHTLGAITSLLHTAMYPEDYARFMKIIEDPDLAVEINLLSDIISDLAAEYTDRPTGESFASSSGKLSTGGDLTAGASLETPTYSRFQPTGPST